MKKNLNIFAMIVAFAALQACGSKSEQNNNDYSAVEDSVTLDATEVKEEVILTADERRVKLEKETAMREEERRIALEELAKTTPTFTDAKGNIVYNKAEVEPSFEGGKKAMMNYLQDTSSFPRKHRIMELRVLYSLTSSFLLMEVYVKWVLRMPPEK